MGEKVDSKGSGQAPSAKSPAGLFNKAGGAEAGSVSAHPGEKVATYVIMDAFGDIMASLSDLVRIGLCLIALLPS